MSIELSDQEKELKKIPNNDKLKSFNGEIAVIKEENYNEVAGTVNITEIQYKFNPLTRKFYKVV